MYKDLVVNKQFVQLLQETGKKEDEEANYFRLVALFGLGQFKDVLSLAPQYLPNTQKYYYEILTIQIKTLMQLNQVDQALNIVQEELKMPYIPTIHEQYFKEVYLEISRRQKQANKSVNPFALYQDYELNEMLISSENQDMILVCLQELATRNIRPFIATLKEFLQDTKRKNIFKVLVLEIFANQGVNEEMFTVVNGVKCEVNPCDLTPLLKQICINEIMEIVQSKESKNKSILDIAEGVLIAYLAAIYPLEIDDDEYSLVAASIYAIALKNLNLESDLQMIASLFDVKPAFLEKYHQEVVNLSTYF